MVKKANQKVRDCALINHMPLWHVAQLLNVSYDTLIRKLRVELPAEEQDRIIGIIEDYAQNGEEA